MFQALTQKKEKKKTEQHEESSVGDVLREIAQNGFSVSKPLMKGHSPMNQLDLSLMRLALTSHCTVLN